MSTYHIARVNIGRIKAPLEDLVMKGFVSRLSEINALADRSPGFEEGSLSGYSGLRV
jgi:hypothetical protein